MSGHHGKLVAARMLCAVLLLPAAAIAADRANGYFRIGDARLDVKHAVAVVEDKSDASDDRHTLIFLSAAPLDAGKVAAAFDDSVEE
jgi:hypothetical protein